MADKSESILLTEYKQISAALENFQSITFKIPPVILTIVCGLTLFKEINPLLIFGIPLAIFFTLIWVGYCHSMINYYGLQLIALEQKINDLQKEDSTEKLSFYTNYICEGSNILIGFAWYSGLVAIFIIPCFLASLWNIWQAWEGLTYPLIEDGYRDVLKYVVIISLALLPIATLVVLYFSEKNYARRKSAILE